MKVYHQEPNLHTAEWNRIALRAALDAREVADSLQVAVVNGYVESYQKAVRNAIRGWPDYDDPADDPLRLKRMWLRPWAALRDYVSAAIGLNVHLNSLAQATGNPDPVAVPLDGFDRRAA